MLVTWLSTEPSGRRPDSASTEEKEPSRARKPDVEALARLLAIASTESVRAISPAQAAYSPLFIVGPRQAYMHEKGHSDGQSLPGFVSAG